VPDLVAGGRTLANKQQREWDLPKSLFLETLTYNLFASLIICFSGTLGENPRFGPDRVGNKVVLVFSIGGCCLSVLVFRETTLAFDVTFFIRCLGRHATLWLMWRLRIPSSCCRVSALVAWVAES
jgi:hypothetical protein